MKSIKVEARYAILEWLPELLCLLTDILIPMAFGLEGSVGGISVVGCLLGAFSRLVGGLSGVCKKQAEKVGAEKRPAILGALLLGGALSVLIATGLWLGRFLLEDLIGLAGIAEYLTYAPWYWLAFRLSVICFIPLGVNEAKMAERVVLSWAVALLNMALTYYWVGVEGVSGSSKATLISTLPSLAVAAWWVYKLKLLKLPTAEVIKLVMPLFVKRVKGDSVAFLNTLTAISLNSWMGAEISLVWSLCHLTCDIAGGLGMLLWGLGSKRLTFFVYGDGADERFGWEEFRWADNWALLIQLTGAVAGVIFVSPCAGVIVAAYAVSKRYTALVEAPASTASEEARMTSKFIWSISCIVGYWGTMLLCDPTISIPTIVYLTAAAASTAYMREVLK